MLAAEPEDLSLVPSSHLVAGENGLLKEVFWLLLWQVSTCKMQINNTIFFLEIGKKEKKKRRQGEETI
jgi:hypothetical protein